MHVEYTLCMRGHMEDGNSTPEEVRWASLPLRWLIRLACKRSPSRIPITKQDT